MIGDSLYLSLLEALSLISEPFYSSPSLLSSFLFLFSSVLLSWPSDMIVRSPTGVVISMVYTTLILGSSPVITARL